jgi:hypothetical protein
LFSLDLVPSASSASSCVRLDSPVNHPATVTVLARSWPYLNLTAKTAVATNLRDRENPALKDLDPSSGAYINEADPTIPNWQDVFFGSHYPRLLNIKQQWDPTGVFWCKPCVGHELWDVLDGPSTEDPVEWGIGQVDGKICRK